MKRLLSEYAYRKTKAKKAKIDQANRQGSVGALHRGSEGTWSGRIGRSLPEGYGQARAEEAESQVTPIQLDLFI